MSSLEVKRIMSPSMTEKRDYISLDSARWRLAYLWFPATLMPFLIMVAQSALGHFGDDVQRAWSWFLPNVMPTLTLILGVLASAAFTPPEAREVRRQFFLLSFWLSAVYLGVLTFTLLLQPFAGLAPVEVMAMSSFWLSPLQSLSAGAIGVLFATQRISTKRKNI